MILFVGECDQREERDRQERTHLPTYAKASTEQIQSKQFLLYSLDKRATTNGHDSKRSANCCGKKFSIGDHEIVAEMLASPRTDDIVRVAGDRWSKGASLRGILRRKPLFISNAYRYDRPQDGGCPQS